MNKNESINKVCGKLQHKVWKRGKLIGVEIETIEQQHDEMGDQLCYKVLDLRKL